MTTLSDASSDSVVCENIGPRERARRLRWGVGCAAVAVGLSAALVATHAPHVWRLTAFVPFVLAGFGFFQAREHTCISNVARNVRNMDDGDKPVTDAAEIRQLAAQARRVYVQSFASAAVLTLVLLFLP
ncbi:MAG TPA: hypothetical protein VMI54_07220 [Polyangiaceae bacterium]|nr:hypothetical protein [Polyangiaceae bacterium]